MGCLWPQNYVFIAIKRFVSMKILYTGKRGKGRAIVYYSPGRVIAILLIFIDSIGKLIIDSINLKNVYAG